MTTDSRDMESNWSNLPTDLLLTIFKKLSLEDLVTGGAPLCCSSWYNASRDPSMFKSPKFDLGFLQGRSFDAKRRAVDFILRTTGGRLTSVKFPVDDHAVDLLLHLAMSSPVLKSFCLEDNFVEKNERVTTIKKFSLAISRLRGLRRMTINKNLICFYVLEQIRHSCPNLTTLEVTDEKTWIVKYVVSKYLPKVKVIGISQTDVDGCNEDESSNLTIIPDNAAYVLRFWSQCMLEVD